MTEQELYDMKLGEHTTSEDGVYSTLRVIGGWIYLFYNIKTGIKTTGVFVPEPDKVYAVSTWTEGGIMPFDYKKAGEPIPCGTGNPLPDLGYTTSVSEDN